MLISDLLVEISLMTKLCDDIAIIDALDYIETFDDAGVVEGLDDGCLALQEPTSNLTFDISSPDLFNCHFLLSININASIDLTKTTLS